jgi:hypothetical protein
MVRSSVVFNNTGVFNITNNNTNGLTKLATMQFSLGNVTFYNSQMKTLI